jgi:hypothetical protein
VHVDHVPGAPVAELGAKPVYDIKDALILARSQTIATAQGLLPDVFQKAIENPGLDEKVNIRIPDEKKEGRKNLGQAWRTVLTVQPTEQRAKGVIDITAPRPFAQKGMEKPHELSHLIFVAENLFK